MNITYAKSASKGTTILTEDLKFVLYYPQRTVATFVDSFECKKN
jgi:hypothetical protein